MKIANQNKNTFGSTFVIRELPVGEKIIASGGFTHIREYITQPIPKFESKINEKTNQAMMNLLDKIQKKFGSSAKIDRSERQNLNLLLNEQVLKVDDSLDSLVEAKLAELNQKKKTYFWQKKYNPQVHYAKFESPKVDASFVEKKYAKLGTGLL